MCDVVKVSESEFEYNVKHRKLMLCLLKDLYWAPEQVVPMSEIGTLFFKLSQPQTAKRYL